MPPLFLPELVAGALPPLSVCAAIPPVLVPELVTAAFPPLTVCTEMPPALTPEFVAVALPPPVVVADRPPLLVPELIVVAFWFEPAAVFGLPVSVPELVQVMSVGVVVQANCAEAGELANSAIAESVAARHAVAVPVLRNTQSLDSAGRDTRLRTTISPAPSCCLFISGTTSFTAKLSPVRHN
jgi:hypothetical protein